MIEFQEIWTPLLIGPFLWLAGLAGMGSVAYVLLRQARVDHLKAFSWVLFISVVAATVFVVADLSRPWNLVNALPTSFFTGQFGLFRSWMAVGIVLLSVAMLLLFLVALRHTINIKILNIVVDAGVELEEGDVVATNDPYISGTHLNDVMVLTPVYWRGKLVAYVVNKAHHVDIGGPTPGSINPNARTIYEEGFILPPVKIMRRGELSKEVVSIWLANVKTPEAAVGDLNAQIAANRVGARRVVELFDKYGEKTAEAWGRP